MKQLLTTIAAVLLVGCGESQQSAPPAEAKTEPPTAKAPDISIHDAAEDGNIEVVKQHLAAGANVNTKGGWLKVTPLHYAADEGHKEIVELLITNGADVNAKDVGDGTPLHNAVAWGRKEIAELLIANGAEVNAKSKSDGTPLHNVESKEIAELLITKGANVNAKADNGLTPLDYAENEPEIADLLRKHGGKTREELKAEGK